MHCSGSLNQMECSTLCTIWMITCCWVPLTLQCTREPLTCCQNLGVQVADHKTEGPSTLLVFLGIEVDTMSRTLWLSSEKLCRLQQEIKKLSMKALLQEKSINISDRTAAACVLCGPTMKDLFEEDD